MSIEIPSRTHIIPMGYERERVYEPAIRLKADEAVIISHTDDKGKFKKYYDDVEEVLQNEGIDIKRDECNIFDVYNSLRVIGRNIREYSNNEVYVNVSSGSKITAIAGMIASMTSGAVPYYAQVEDYSGDAPTGVTDIIELPKYPIDRPSLDHLAILDYLIYNGPATKGELIEFSEKSNLEFISDFSGKEKAKYRRIDTNVIDPLLNRGYINVEKEGRSKLVDVTESGKDFRNAFVHLADRQTTLEEDF